MLKVLISDKLHAAGASLLENTKDLLVVQVSKLSEEALCEQIADADALIVRSGTQVTETVLKAAKLLKVVGRAGIGVDNIDVKAASRQGVLVMNAPSGNSITTAEHAVSMLMSLARNIPQATASMKAGRWEKSRFMGRELYERTLGVIGFGNIGRLVAVRAKALGMNVITADPYTNEETTSKMGVSLVELDTLLATADAITIHTPLTRETKGIIGATAFAKMKSGMLLVNCARGGIVDEEALLDALEKRIVAGAALDVFEVEPPPSDHPLLSRDDVICTPHLGAATSEAQEKVAVELCAQVADYLTDGTIRNAINLPAVRGEVPAYVQPFVTLADRLGSFAGQVFGAFNSIEVCYAGDVFGEMNGLGLVTNAAIRGLLSTAMDVPVNLVNAPILAQERGIKIKESRTVASGAFANLVTVIVKKGKESASVAGTLFNDSDPRLVRLRNFSLEVPLEGSLLVLKNDNRPGVIGNVGTVLGSNEINVSRLHVGLNKSRGEAIAIWNIEGSIPQGLVGVIESLPHILAVKVVAF